MAKVFKFRIRRIQNSKMNSERSRISHTSVCCQMMAPARKDDEELSEHLQPSFERKHTRVYQRGGHSSRAELMTVSVAKEGVSHGTGDSGGANCFHTRWRLLSTCLSLVLIIGLMYYQYLNALYLIDEVYDGGALREFRLLEKTTIRVAVTSDRAILQDFLGHFSLCEAVHEIQVLWPRDHPIPSVSAFQFKHTHSLVSFEHAGPEALLSPSIPIETASVLLLDADVRLACKDVAFTVSVWRSGSKSVVGFFPRLHVSDTKLGHINRVLGWEHVFLQGAYSIMLSGGAMVSTTLLAAASPSYSTHGMSDDVANAGVQQEKSASSVTASSTSSTTIPTNSTKLQASSSHAFLNTLSKNPDCNSVAVSLWCASNPVYKCSPPVWVKLSSLVILRGVRIPITITKSRQDQCIRLLSRELGVSSLPVSSHKAVRASERLFW